MCVAHLTQLHHDYLGLYQVGSDRWRPVLGALTQRLAFLVFFLLLSYYLRLALVSFISLLLPLLILLLFLKKMQSLT